MNRYVSRTPIAALFILVSCGGGTKNQEPSTPTSTSPESQSAASAGNTGTGTSSLNSASDNSTMNGPGSTNASSSSNPPSSTGMGPSTNPTTNGSSTTSTTPGSSGTSSSSFTNSGAGDTGNGTSGRAGGIGGGALPSASSLTDEQILQLLHTANAGEIEQAKIAQRKSKNGQVKHFASMMVKDHTDADRKGQDVAAKLNNKPMPSATNTKLESDARQMTSSMSTRTGADFDQAYIDAQVKEHQQLLDLIDTQLLPSAKSADVKNVVQTVRPKVQSHLQEAQDIQRKLAGS
jgi:putative membrane protein